MVRLYFVQLFKDSRMVYGKTTQLSERDGGLVVLVHLDQVTWSLGQEDQTKIVSSASKLSGSETYPMTRIKDHRNWIAIGMR
jgi:hypothetical protein